MESALNDDEVFHGDPGPAGVQPLSFIFTVARRNLSFGTRILRWYDSAKRTCRGGARATRIRIWLSEIMLQQTRRAAAVPYFERFLERFPGCRGAGRPPQSPKSWPHGPDWVTTPAHATCTGPAKRDCGQRIPAGLRRHPRTAGDRRVTRPRPSPASPSACRTRCSRAT